jgi:hypothetical protein
MNDDFKEEMRDCYAEITRLTAENERLAEQERRKHASTVMQQATITRLTAEVERLKAALIILIEQISMMDGITRKIIIRRNSLDKAALLKALYEAYAILPPPPALTQEENDGR